MRIVSHWSALSIPNSSQSIGKFKSIKRHCRNSLNGFETHSPVTGLSHEHGESLFQSYSLLLTGNGWILQYYQQLYSHIHKIYPGRCGILASSAASPEAQTFSCNNRDHRKAVPCCAPFRDQKVEGRSSHIEAIDIQSIQIIVVPRDGSSSLCTVRFERREYLAASIIVIRGIF